MALSTTELIEKIISAFKYQSIIPIDAIKLEHTGIYNTYILCVSAPSLSSRHYGAKVESIISILFAHTTLEIRGMIDRVKVFDSIEHMENPDKIDLNIGKTFKV